VNWAVEPRDRYDPSVTMPALPPPRGLALALALLGCAGPSTPAASEPRVEPAGAGDRPTSLPRGTSEAQAPNPERDAPTAAPRAAIGAPEVPRGEPEALSPLAEAPPEAPAAPPRPPPIAIQKGTRVLMFGDSMVTSGLGVYLEERVRALGGTWSHFSKPSSTTVSWADGRDLQELVARARPDVVVIALVSNELFVPNPRARIYAIREIIKRVGARPCLWIGPPSWRPDKGIVAVVRETASSCRFFDSAQLPLERQSDGIHPTLHGGRAWGEAVWQDAFASTSSP
jgi:hypothetical protein